jgi:hypothetical protein
MVPPTVTAAAAAFSSYDRNGNGFISIDELKALLTDLGMLKGMSPSAAAAFVVSQFAMADSKTKDGKLDPQEFNRLYLKLAAPRLLEVLQADVPEQLAQLRHTFFSFAGFGSRSGGQAAPSGLDGVRVLLLVLACDMLGGGVNTQVTHCKQTLLLLLLRFAHGPTMTQFSQEIVGLI